MVCSLDSGSKGAGSALAGSLRGKSKRKGVDGKNICFPRIFKSFVAFELEKN